MYIIIVTYFLSVLNIIKYLGISKKGIIYLIMYIFNYIDYNSLIIGGLIVSLSNYNYIRIFTLLFITIAQSYNLQYYSLLSLWVKGLLYGLNLIHPLLFYFIIINLFIYLNFNFKNFKTTISTIFYIAVFSLCLGMIWGSINDGWGFFWTNDLIELVLLFYIILITIIVHKIHLNIFKYVLIYIVISVLLIFVRFNIVFSVHSFFISSKIKSFYLWIYSWLQFIACNNYSILIYYLLLFILIFYYFILFYINSKKLYLNNFYITLLHLTIFLVFISFMFNITYYIIINSVFIKSYKFILFEIYNLSSNTHYILLNEHLLSNINKTLNYLLIYKKVANLNYSYFYILYLMWFYFNLLLFLISIFKIYNK